MHLQGQQKKQPNLLYDINGEGEQTSRSGSHISPINLQSVAWCFVPNGHHEATPGRKTPPLSLDSRKKPCFSSAWCFTSVYPKSSTRPFAPRWPSDGRFPVDPNRFHGFLPNAPAAKDWLDPEDPLHQLRPPSRTAASTTDVRAFHPHPERFPPTRSTVPGADGAGPSRGPSQDGLSGTFRAKESMEAGVNLGRREDQETVSLLWGRRTTM